MPRQGKRYRFECTMDMGGATVRKADLVFWAEGGFVAMLDEDDGTFIVVTRKDFLLRALAVNRHNRAELLPDERNKIQKCVNEMMAAVKEAKQQGDPTDPKVVAWYQRHRPKARGRSRGGASWESGPDPTKPKGSRLIFPDGIL